jgi:hypothetical protein
MIYTDNVKYESYINSVAAVLNVFNSLTEITVDVVKKCDSDAGGYCMGDTDEISIEVATHVQGEPLDEETIYRNIAHEMIHAEQIISGRLDDLGLQLLQSGDSQSLVKVSIWDGETYTNTKYEDQPWEIDAYAREEQVMNEALQYV